MEFFRDPKIDFLGKKFFFLTISGLFILASIVSLSTRGLRYGIDFRGGADVVLRFSEPPSLDQIRNLLSSQGLEGSQIQNLSLPESPDAHDVLIRVPPLGEDGGGDAKDGGDVSKLVIDTLRSGLEGDAPGEGTIDLNRAGVTEIARALSAAFPDRTSMAAESARAVVEYRNRHSGILSDVEEATRVEGVSPEAAAWLRNNASAGGFAIRSADYVGPSVGRELKQSAALAVIGSLVVMLFYIWLRFKKLAFALAAVITLGHDAIVALGAVSLSGKEFDLTVLAAILTIVGYSINDTIVVFDRVRENMQRRRGDRLESLFNDSINQTLARTVLTTLLVMLVVGTLWIFGGSRLNPFSFTLLVGVISGVYSTVYVASPIVIWLRAMVEKGSAA